MAQANEKCTALQAETVGDALLAAPVDSQRRVRETIERARTPKPKAGGFVAMLPAIAAMFGFRAG
jgi:hypothetical protein